jgi:hypothetical protein
VREEVDRRMGKEDRGGGGRQKKKVERRERE